MRGIGELEAVLLGDQRHALDVHAQVLRCHAGHDALGCFGTHGRCKLVAFFAQAFVVRCGAVEWPVDADAAPQLN